MQPAYSPSVRRRRLRTQLLRYRERAGLTTAQVAKELGWPQVKVSRLETGFKKSVTSDELDALLDFYEEDDAEVRASLHECARLAKERGWWARYRNLMSTALPDFETEASVIKTYECQVVPGLLQTPDYAEAIFRANLVRSDEEIRERVSARLKRQEILNRVDPPAYWVILDEAALRRVVGSVEVMSQQLRHLTHMAARHNINIYVLPYSAGAHPVTVGSFVIMDFPDPLDASIGYVETPISSLYVEEDHELTELNSLFGGAQGSAMSPAHSLQFIKDVTESLENESSV
ncbi:helix-turn-helix transcriptional regulator [Streptomonospora halophila]|uniref:Helix-turn-helix transcriptional regulator n=1 Tax=Streptomonospora halophila TaxID=427369 RepID=A0ABP9GDE9_9ACTN